MKTVIEMAREAGFAERDSMFRVVFVANKYDLEKFAALIEAAARADEREECAALCFSIWNKWLDTPEEDRYKVLYDAEDCADAIRARETT